MATLVDLIRQIGWGEPSAQPAGGGGAFFEQGEVTSVDGMGKLTVSVGGRTVWAETVTDEPFRVGAKVWVSEAGGAYIVHGGVRCGGER
jgi:hypothetical protein